MDVPALLKGMGKPTEDRHGFWLSLPAQKLHDALKALKGVGLWRLSSISGIDTGKAIEVVYHLPFDHRVVNIRVSLPRDSPSIGTITGIYPGAHLYERELMEMLGVRVEGHPDPRPLFLCQSSPATPLRKQLIEQHSKKKEMAPAKRPARKR